MLKLGIRVKVINEYGIAVNGVIQCVNAKNPGKIIYTIFTDSKKNIFSEFSNIEIIEDKNSETTQNCNKSKLEDDGADCKLNFKPDSSISKNPSMVEVDAEDYNKLIDDLKKYKIISEENKEINEVKSELKSDVKMQDDKLVQEKKRRGRPPKSESEKQIKL